MNLSINPGSKSFLYNYITTPHLEGRKNLKQAWNATTCPYKDRVFLAVKGILLIIPLVNTITWIAIQALSAGNPSTQSLSEPSDTKQSTLPTDSKTPNGYDNSTAIDIDDFLKESEVVDIEDFLKESEKFTYKETVGDQSFRAEWEITTLDDQPIGLKKTSHPYYNETTSTYCPKKGLVAFVSIDKKMKLLAKKINETTIQITTTEPIHGEPNTKFYKIPKNHVWIQQPIIGFKQFVQSKDTKIQFFIVTPHHGIQTCSGEKTDLEEVDGLGTLQKIELTLEPSFVRFKGEAWADPKTGITKKAICPSIFMFSPKMSEEHLPSDPSPV